MLVEWHDSGGVSFRVHVGFLQHDSTEMYLALRLGRDTELRGVYDVLDLFELPPQLRVHAWPLKTPTDRLNPV